MQELVDLLETTILTIYTDGSVTANDTGAVGIRIISVDSSGDEITIDSYSAGYRNVNSGQIEIIACTAALEEATRQKYTSSIRNVIVLTDSKYVADNYREAMFEWSRNGWLRKTGRPVPDAQLWKELVKQITNYNQEHIFVEIKWVKGHEKDKHNKAVDMMSRKASRLPLAQIPKNGPITIFQPKKAIPSPRMEMGSVKMLGQRISIKILSCKLLKPQNLWCYQYQVISKRSPFIGRVDQIFSSFSLDPGKSYCVKLNSAEGNPRIEKLYWEIKRC